MQQLSEFLHMGGYAVYVWSAYGLCLVTLLLNLILPFKTESKILQAVRKRQEREKLKS
jgi:heme exporter protein D